jgi:hypothetical protein
LYPIVDIRNRPTAVTAVPTMGKILYRPVRLVTAPDAIEAAGRPPTGGSVRTPDAVAETPSTDCRYVGR